MMSSAASAPASHGVVFIERLETVCHDFFWKSPDGLPNAGRVQERTPHGNHRPVGAKSLHHHAAIEWRPATGRPLQPGFAIANSTSSASASKLIAATGSRVAVAHQIERDGW